MNSRQKFTYFRFCTRIYEQAPQEIFGEHRILLIEAYLRSHTTKHCYHSLLRITRILIEVGIPGDTWEVFSLKECTQASTGFYGKPKPKLISDHPAKLNDITFLS
jgi:hypothetical protein